MNEATSKRVAEQEEGVHKSRASRMETQNKAFTERLVKAESLPRVTERPPGGSEA